MSSTNKDDHITLFFNDLSIPRIPSITTHQLITIMSSIYSQQLSVIAPIKNRSLQFIRSQQYTNAISAQFRRIVTYEIHSIYRQYSYKLFYSIAQQFTIFCEKNTIQINTELYNTLQFQIIKLTVYALSCLLVSIFQKIGAHTWGGYMPPVMHTFPSCAQPKLFYWDNSTPSHISNVIKKGSITEYHEVHNSAFLNNASSWPILTNSLCLSRLLQQSVFDPLEQEFIKNKKDNFLHLLKLFTTSNQNIEQKTSQFDDNNDTNEQDDIIQSILSHNKAPVSTNASPYSVHLPPTFFPFNTTNGLYHSYNNDDIDNDMIQKYNHDQLYDSSFFKQNIFFRDVLAESWFLSFSSQNDSSSSVASPSSSPSLSSFIYLESQKSSTSLSYHQSVDKIAKCLGINQYFVHIFGLGHCLNYSFDNKCKISFTKALFENNNYCIEKPITNDNLFSISPYDDNANNNDDIYTLIRDLFPSTFYQSSIFSPYIASSPMYYSILPTNVRYHALTTLHSHMGLLEATHFDTTRPSVKKIQDNSKINNQFKEKPLKQLISEQSTLKQNVPEQPVTPTPNPASSSESAATVDNTAVSTSTTLKKSPKSRIVSLLNRRANQSSKRRKRNQSNTQEKTQNNDDNVPVCGTIPGDDNTPTTDDNTNNEESNDNNDHTLLTANNTNTNAKTTIQKKSKKSKKRNKVQCSLHPYRVYSPVYLTYGDLILSSVQFTKSWHPPAPVQNNDSGLDNTAQNDDNVQSDSESAATTTTTTTTAASPTTTVTISNRPIMFSNEFHIPELQSQLVPLYSLWGRGMFKSAKTLSEISNEKFIASNLNNNNNDSSDNNDNTSIHNASLNDANMTQLDNQQQMLPNIHIPGFPSSLTVHSDKIKDSEDYKTTSCSNTECTIPTIQQPIRPISTCAKKTILTSIIGNFIKAHVSQTYSPTYQQLAEEHDKILPPNPFPWYPETYNFPEAYPLYIARICLNLWLDQQPVTSFYHNLLQLINQQGGSHSQFPQWIVKPASGSCGHGIHVMSHESSLSAIVEEKNRFFQENVTITQFANQILSTFDKKYQSKQPDVTNSDTTATELVNLNDNNNTTVKIVVTLTQFGLFSRALDLLTAQNDQPFAMPLITYYTLRNFLTEQLQSLSESTPGASVDIFVDVPIHMLYNGDHNLSPLANAILIGQRQEKQTKISLEKTEKTKNILQDQSQDQESCNDDDFSDEDLCDEDNFITNNDNSSISKEVIEFENILNNQHNNIRIPSNISWMFISPSQSFCGGNAAVISVYLDPPLLFRQRKFDLRLYVCVTSQQPVIAWVHRLGLVRLCTEIYQDDKQQQPLNEQPLNEKNLSSEDEDFQQSEKESPQLSLILQDNKKSQFGGVSRLSQLTNYSLNKHNKSSFIVDKHFDHDGSYFESRDVLRENMGKTINNDNITIDKDEKDTIDIDVDINSTNSSHISALRNDFDEFEDNDEDSSRFYGKCYISTMFRLLHRELRKNSSQNTSKTSVTHNTPINPEDMTAKISRLLTETAYLICEQSNKFSLLHNNQNNNISPYDQTCYGIDPDIPFLSLLAYYSKNTNCSQYHALRSDKYIPNSASLLGFDVMVDITGHPWLIEINTAPSLEFSSFLDVRTKQAVVTQVLQLNIVASTLVTSFRQQIFLILQQQSQNVWNTYYKYLTYQQLVHTPPSQWPEQYLAIILSFELQYNVSYGFTRICPLPPVIDDNNDTNNSLKTLPSSLKLDCFRAWQKHPKEDCQKTLKLFYKKAFNKILDIDYVTDNDNDNTTDLISFTSLHDQNLDNTLEHPFFSKQ